MKWKKIASLLLITALFLSFLGCGERAQPESTAPDDSALLQMRQYQSSMEAFQSDCTQQIHAFTASLQSGDTEAGNAAADTLTTRLAGFEKIPVPSGCQEIQPFFACAAAGAAQRVGTRGEERRNPGRMRKKTVQQA